MDKILEEYLESLKSNFSDEAYYKNINESHEKWLNNVESESDKLILNKLFLNLIFFSKKEIKERLHEEIIKLEKKHYNLNQTVMLPLSPVDGRYSGSNELIGLLKEFDREEQIMFDRRILPLKLSILNDLNYADEADTLIFLDDIVGTGGTLETFIAFHYNRLKNKKIIFLFLTVTKEAIKKFGEIQVKYNDIKFEFIYCRLLEKVSENDILTSKEYERLVEIEENLWGKGNNNILGFKKSELLILFSHNIPNNTLSNFWYPKNDNKWYKLFKRITVPNRKKQNYSNAKRR